MKSKVIAIMFILVLSVMQLTACGFHRNNTEEYKTPARQARELQTKIMECFVNKDKDSLREFFSEYTLNHCLEINEQIEEAFSLFDGEIVSYDEPDGDAIGGFDNKSYGASTSNIKTDKGTEYWITFKGELTCAKDESKEGVTYIKVVNITEYRQHEEKDRDAYVAYIGTGY